MKRRKRVQLPEWDPSKLRAEIDKRGLKRSFVAEKLGIAKGSLDQILQGRRPGPQTVKLAVLFFNLKDESELGIQGDRAS